MLKKNQIVKSLQRIPPAKLALLKFCFILAITVFLGVVFGSQAAVAYPNKCSAYCDPDSPLYGELDCQICKDGHGDSDIFGPINPPPGVAEYNEAAGGEIGIIKFLSSLIRLATIVAGIWTMINFILAGWTYIISSGDPSANEKASKQMINSVIGLVIVALAYTIAAALGLIIFGDASYIINPPLTTVDDL